MKATGCNLTRLGDEFGTNLKHLSCKFASPGLSSLPLPFSISLPSPEQGETDEYAPWSHQIPSSTDMKVDRNALTRLPKNLGSVSGSLARLTVLDVSSNQIESLPSRFGTVSGGLPALSELQLSGNALTRLPDGFGSTPDGLPSLRSLGLSHNSLESLPDGFVASPGRLQNLVELVLESNSLRALPRGFAEEPGTAPSLSVLILKNNRLRNISSDFTMMSGKRLQLLDFSFNAMEGPLPLGILSLPLLQYLVSPKNARTRGAIHQSDLISLLMYRISMATS